MQWTTCPLGPSTCPHTVSLQRRVWRCQQACRQPAQRTCNVTAMAKRGPKSERRAAKAAKQESKPPAPQTDSPLADQPEQRSAAEQAAQSGAAPPLASQPAQANDGASITVGDRILPRMLLFSGVPVFLGLLLLPGFWYLKVVQGLEVPVWLVYLATFVFFGTGFAGITYGIFSASWDPRQEGSLLGTEEFKQNLPEFMNRRK